MENTGVDSRAIRVRIAELGIRNNSVAERLGVSEQTFSRKMNGKNPWTISEIVEMANMFGCTTDELLGRGQHVINV